MEVWKDVAGYEGYYQVSNWGRLKSLARDYRHSDKILKLDQKGNGYMQAHLCRDGKAKWFHVHRLVASAFLDPVEGCNIINHIDNDRKNNNVDNLEWTTQKGNIQHAMKQGRMYLQYKRRSICQLNGGNVQG